MVVLWLTRPEPPPEPIDGIEITLTAANLRDEVLDDPGFVLVDFWYEHCPPCRRMEPTISHLSLNYRDRVKVGRVDVEEDVELTEQFHVEAFPTMLLFRDGEVVARWEGYGGLKEVSQWIDKQLTVADSGGPDQT
jgi:thioredoxin 1